MLIATIAKLQELSKIHPLSSSQRARAITLMKKVRSHGFSNRDVEVFVDGRWKVATIKKYTRGVKVRTTEERDRVLETFSRFVASGKTLEDVENYVVSDERLRAYGVSLEVVAEFISRLGRQQINISKLFDLYIKTEESEYTIADLSDGLDTIRSLEDQGISKEILEDLNRETKKYGSLEGLLNAITMYGSIEQIKIADDIAKNMLNDQRLEIKKNENDIKKMEAKALAYKSYMDVAQALVSEHSFDLHSLKTLMEIAEKHGDPSQILEALNTYSNIEELKKEIAVTHSEIGRLQKERKEKEVEVETLNRFIEKANRAIGEIEANYNKSIDIQAISEIIYGHKEIEIKPWRFKQIALLFLIGINRHVRQNISQFSDWEEKFVGSNIRYAIDYLTKIV